MSTIEVAHSPQHVTKAVQRGRDLLDAMAPGWANRIDTIDLDMGADNHCILGQLFGGYEEGKQALGLANDDIAAHHGFYATNEMCSRYTEPYKRMTMIWRKLLR
jgi:hypothetical protein